MNHILVHEEVIYIAEGCSADGVPFIAGAPKSQISRLNEQGLRVQMNLFFCVVAPGLIVAKTRFKGLNRNLLTGQDMNGASGKEVHCWVPQNDFEWAPDDSKNRDGLHPGVVPVTPPAGMVFFTILSPNKMLELYPTIDYWVEHWGWIEQSQELAYAPREWATRYDSQLSPASL